MPMNVHHYFSASGKDLILDYMDTLPNEEKVDGYFTLQCLENRAPDKKEPGNIKFKHWEGKIYEIRFLRHNRLFCIVPDKDTVYLIHACRKQKNRTERKDSRIVKQRAKELGHILKKSFI